MRIRIPKTQAQHSRTRSKLEHAERIQGAGVQEVEECSTADKLDHDKHKGVKLDATLDYTSCISLLNEMGRTQMYGNPRGH
jgi:hypothetical protein